MNTAEIRHILEKKILGFRNSNKSLSQTDFIKYYNCLMTLCSLDRIQAMKQERIYTATYGDIGEFIGEFIKHISPLIMRNGKTIRASAVLDSKTNILFSPRYIEIALGCILSIFLKNSAHMSLSVFAQNNNIVIHSSGKAVFKKDLPLRCIQKIASLHRGKCVVGFGSDLCEIALVLPLLPRLHPLKVVPCSPELCRLCNI